MRKSTAIVTAILLCAFGAMLVAADMALGPLAHDAGIGKELTTLFLHRQDLLPDTQIRVLRLPASEKRLADRGRGLVVRATPAERFSTRRGGLLPFVRRLGDEILEAYEGERVDWVEVELRVGDASLRTLLRRTEDGDLGRPEPPLNLPVRACRDAKAR